MDHRLLAVHVFPGFHGIDGSLLVPVVRRRHDYGVDIFARQNLAVIAGRENIVPPKLLAVLQAPVVTIGNGNQLHARNLHRELRVSLSLNSRSNKCQLNMIVGRKSRGGRALRSQRIYLPAHSRGCGRRSRHLQKRSAI